MSVYVADDLWERARQARPEAPSASQIVQDALLRMAEEHQSQERVPAEVASEFDAARDRLLQEAATEFDRGYRAALTVSAELGWSDIEHLADGFKFDVKQWAEAWGSDAQRHDLARAGIGPGRYPGEEELEPKKVIALMKALGGWASPHGSEEWVPRQTYVKGFSQAMRSLWTSVATHVGEPAEQRGNSDEADKGVLPESAN